MLEYLEDGNKEKADRYKGHFIFYSKKERRFFKNINEIARFYKIGYETLVMKMQRGKDYGIIKM